MVERYRRGKGKRKLLGSHQKCWIWGRHVVQETLKAGRWIPLELFLAETLSAGERRWARQQAEDGNIPVQVVSPDRLQQLAHTKEHQGYLARMPEFPYATAAELLSSPPASPLYLLLDGIQDPYNLGAVIRTAEVFAADAVILRESGQVGVTSLVARTSAGAVNHLPIARVADPVEFVRRLKEQQITTVGTAPDAAVRLFDAPLAGPLALVIGNEGQGMSPELQEVCETVVSIPRYGRTASLNAAVATGILCYESRRQRALKGIPETSSAGQKQ